MYSTIQIYKRKGNKQSQGANFALKPKNILISKLGFSCLSFFFSIQSIQFQLSCNQLELILIYKIQINNYMKQDNKQLPLDSNKQPNQLAPGLSKAQLFLKNILTNTILFEKEIIDDTLFKSDLVIKVEVPSQTYAKRNQKIELGTLIKNYPHSMYKAYQTAYAELFSDMQKRGDDLSKQQTIEKQLQTRVFASFVPVQNVGNSEKAADQVKDKKIRSIRLSSKQFRDEQQLLLKCQDEATGVLDAFILYYNSLIYTLQQISGFKVKSFMVTEVPTKKGTSKTTSRIQGTLDSIIMKNQQVKRTIYLLLYLPDTAMIKAANKYHIKKQIDYTQVDPYLNDPLDRANRPLRFHSEIEKQLKSRQTKKVETPSFPVNEEIDNNSDQSEGGGVEVMMKRKKIDRKIGFILPEHINKKGAKIMNEAEVSEKKKTRYVSFCYQLHSELENLIHLQDNRDMFEDESNKDKLTQNEREYLRYVNRGKLNKGVEKMFMKIKKKRRYWQTLQRVSKQYNFKTYQKPKLYANFQLADKKKKFFARLQKILLYKEIKVSPYGEIALFNKMERIKLSYLVLSSNVRVQNFYAMKMNVFALTDVYEKQGKLGKADSKNFYYHYENKSKQKVKRMNGGLNGHNLQSDWYRFFVWKTSIDTIRNYFGQIKAYEIFIKTYIIQLFMVLTPFGAAAQVLKMVFIDTQSQGGAFIPEVYFLMIYMAIISFSYGFFIEKYRCSQQSFMKNFEEQSAYVEFMDQYHGPYKRDSLTDNPNTYNQKDLSFCRSFKYKVVSLFALLVFGLIIACEIGFYYGIRFFIIEIMEMQPDIEQYFIHFVYPFHIIGYSIYFIVNLFVEKYIILNLAKYITKIENRATKENFLRSVNIKRLIYAVFTELIGPIDLIYIQYASMTNCYASWCASQFKAYAYSRFIIVLAFSLFSIFQKAIKICYNKIRHQGVIGDGQRVPISNYSQKLFSYLEFIYKQSKKDPPKDFDVIDQTISLVHFALFICVLPFAPVISLVYIMFSYNAMREYMLKNQQRPIPRIEKLISYEQTIEVIGHLLLLFNFSYMFITLEWYQYNFADILIELSSPLSANTVMTVKYFTILFFFGIYQVILLIGKSIAKKFGSFVNERKHNMYKKYQMKVFNQGGVINLKQPKPLYSISRTFCININKRESEENNSSEHGLVID